MVEALQRLWATLGDRWPEKVQTDSGGEFYNAIHRMQIWRTTRTARD